MASHRLKNYLRTYRKRVGFTQGEVAFLLGVRNGSKASRYENFARQPNLRTALAYEAIFQTPVRELFAGIYDEVEKAVATKAKILKYKYTLGPSRHDRRTGRKLEFVTALAVRTQRKKKP